VLGKCLWLLVDEIFRTGHTSIVKLIMMQAIVYGTLTEVGLLLFLRSKFDVFFDRILSNSASLLRLMPKV